MNLLFVVTEIVTYPVKELSFDINLKTLMSALDMS